MTGSNAEDTGPLIIANIRSVANSGPWLPASAGRLGRRETENLLAHPRQLGLAAPADRVGKIKAFEPAIERPPAQAEHLRGRLLVSARLGQRALDVLALHGRQRLAVVVGWKLNLRRSRGRLRRRSHHHFALGDER